MRIDDIDLERGIIIVTWYPDSDYPQPFGHAIPPELIANPDMSVEELTAILMTEQPEPIVPTYTDPDQLPQALKDMAQKPEKIYFWLDGIEGYCYYDYDIPDGAVTVKPLEAYLIDADTVRDTKINCYVTLEGVTYYSDEGMTDETVGDVEFNADADSKAQMNVYITEKMMNGIIGVNWTCKGCVRFFTVQEFAPIYRAIVKYTNEVFGVCGSHKETMTQKFNNGEDISNYDFTTGYPSKSFPKA